LEEIVARFEAAWQHGEQPRIEDYLPPQADLRRAALIELAHAELEFRLEAGEPALAEDYLQRFTELAEDSAALASLLVAEYALRRRARPSHQRGEVPHKLRFDANLLAARLPTLAGPPAAGNADSTSPAPAAEMTLLPATTVPGPKSAAPAEPGRYRALAPHARGGLGEVLVAEDAQLGRRVALKRIQPRWRHDAEARRRFLLEAEVTGRLEHPGVVPVYSLTEDADGELCYAMRFVEGETLQQAIRRYHASPGALELRQLLSRFVAVCNAVGYAHSRGVLHRDLKPANIMLGKYGETLLVDWGLAKPFQRSEEARTSGEQTLVPAEAASGDGTRLGQAVGTPAYMAPEQAAGAWESIGSATDVYALGATLYCLLTGRAPFDDPDAQQVLARVQRGVFPPPHDVRPEVPAALEAVCLKAMSRRPEGRYGSALELAADVERWLADEPVAAYPEPLAARLRRQARRHPAALAAAAGLLLAGLVGLGLGLAAVQAEKQHTAAERDRAEENATAAAEAGSKAQEQAGRAEALNKFLLEDLLAEAAPEKNPRAKKVTVEEVLDKAAAKVEKGFVRQPDTEADVRLAVGETYRLLGLYERGRPHLEQALALRRQRLGPDHPFTLDAVDKWALLLRDQGKLAEAEPLFRQNLKARRRVLGPDHPDALDAVNNLALLLKDEGNLAEAEPLLRQNLEAHRRVQGPDHPDTLLAVNNLASLLWDQGKLAEAELLCRQNVVDRRRVSGPDHPNTLKAVNNLANLLREQGNSKEAEFLLRQNLEAMRRVQGPDHSDTLCAVNNLAMLLQDQGKVAEAELLFRQNLEAQRRGLGPDHPFTLIGVNNLAMLLQDQGKVAEAEPLIRQNLAAQRRVLGPDHPNTLAAGNNLAGLLQEEGKLVEAEAVAREALARGRTKLPAGHPTLAGSLSELGAIMTANGRPQEAMPLLREALDYRRKGLPPGHPKTAQVESQLGGCLLALKQFAEAEPLLLAGYRGLEKDPGTPARERAKARGRLVELYEAWGKPAEAAKWKAEMGREVKPGTPKGP
jgi:tRNA A-37 threonylcarbamoyl transferase component Bud32